MKRVAQTNRGFSYRVVALLYVMLASSLAYLVAMADTPTAGAMSPQAPSLATYKLPSSPNVTDVSIVDFDFSPQTVTVTVGTSVRWTNTGARTHTSTSDTSVWDSGNLGSGQQFSFTF